MGSVSLDITIPQLLALVEQLPREVKARLVREWAKELNTNELEASLKLEGYDEPFDLEEAALSKKDLQELQELWKDELPAEELAKLLTT